MACVCDTYGTFLQRSFKANLFLEVQHFLRKTLRNKTLVKHLFFGLQIFVKVPAVYHALCLVLKRSGRHVDYSWSLHSHVGINIDQTNKHTKERPLQIFKTGCFERWSRDIY